MNRNNIKISGFSFPVFLHVLIIPLFIFIMLSFSSCSILGILSSSVSTTQDNADLTDEGSQTEESSIESNENGTSSDTETGDETTETAKESSDEQTAETEPQWTSLNIKVYYVDEQAQFLVGEERKVEGKYKEDFILAAFNELLKGPESKEIYNLLPIGTKILSVEFLDNYAFLNLSEEFVDNKAQDSLVDYLVISSIANTITEIPGVEGVLFKVEMENLSVYGELDLNNPWMRNEKLIKK